MIVRILYHDGLLAIEIVNASDDDEIHSGLDLGAS